MNATKRRNWTLWERRREGTGLWERGNGHRFRDITSDITSVTSLDSTSDVTYHFCVATEAKRRNWGPGENLRGLLDDPSGQQSEGPVHWKGLPPLVPILAERAPYVVRVAVIAHFHPAVAINCVVLLTLFEPHQVTTISAGGGRGNMDQPMERGGIRRAALGSVSWAHDSLLLGSVLTNCAGTGSRDRGLLGCGRRL